MPTLRLAFRALLRSPAYTLTTILTIGLGIAANAVVFSVANAVLFRALPYPQPEQLFQPIATRRGTDGSIGQFNPTDVEYLRWHEQSRTLDVGAMLTAPAALTGGGEPVAIQLGQVSASLFHVLGVGPERGRVFTEAEDQPDASVAVVSHGFWQAHLGGRLSALNETIEMNGQPYRVIGVMPTGFAPATVSADVWTPIAITRTHLRQPSTARVIQVIGRARNGATPAQINAEYRKLADDITAEIPAEHDGWSAEAIPLREALVGDQRPALIALGCLVAFLLLLVSANVANLAFARLSARRTESNVRIALGGNRWHLLQPLLGETVIIASVGFGLGLALAAVALPALRSLDGGATLLLDTMRLDIASILFALATTVVAAGLSFAIPGVRMVRATSIGRLVGAAPRTSTASTRERMFGRTLMIVQVAMALVLSIGAMSAVGALRHLSGLDLGLNSRNVTLATITLPSDRYATHASRAQFTQLLEAAGRQIPGVTGFSVVSNSFLPGTSRQTALVIVGREQDEKHASVVHFRRVGSDYFRTLNIPLVRGRVFDTHDADGAVPVAVVSSSFAQRVLPNEDPIGKSFVRTAARSQTFTIVGVVRDVRDTGFGDDVSSMIYVPHAQVSVTNPAALSIVARSTLRPSEIRDQIAKVVRGVDPLLPVERTVKLEERLDDSLAGQRFRVALFSVFAVLGLVLACVGVYGMTSYAIVSRTREVSIRMALGARAWDIIAMIGRESLSWIVTGLTIGGMIAAGLAQLARAKLTNVLLLDTAVVAEVCALVGLVVLVATLIPARRITRAEPAEALRG